MQFLSQYILYELFNTVLMIVSFISLGRVGTPMDLIRLSHGEIRPSVETSIVKHEITLLIVAVDLNELRLLYLFVL